jgi:hypothetical protein
MRSHVSFQINKVLQPLINVYPHTSRPHRVAAAWVAPLPLAQHSLRGARIRDKVMTLAGQSFMAMSIRKASSLKSW